MKVTITSKNPVKISATKKAFKNILPQEEILITPISVPSGISDQPMNEEETLQGAINRVKEARKQVKDSDFWIGIEGGVAEYNNTLMCFGWVYIEWKDGQGLGRSNSFPLSGKIKKYLDQGLELGEADDIVFKKHNSKQKNGAIGLLTDNYITRETLFIPAITFALIPYKNKNLYNS
jgi:inosine/xanthosine triphosphatase